MNDEELTDLLKGNMITATVADDKKLEIGFDDGTWIAVPKPPDAPATDAPTGGIVEAVQQSEGELELILKGGETLQIDTDASGPEVATVLKDGRLKQTAPAGAPAAA